MTLAARRFIIMNILLLTTVIHAEPINVARLADAIYLAEGGTHTSNPYGIMRQYQHTTARKACVNTICHRLKEWQAAGQPGDFIAFLGKTYAPQNCSNDPHGLNRNWIKNVKTIYAKENKTQN